MSKGEVIILEKQVTETKYYCDICGRKANGEFDLDMHINDDYVDSFYCPLDLCKICMELYGDFLNTHTDAMKYVDARRSGFSCSDTNKKKLIKALKDMYRENGLQDDEKYIKRVNELKEWRF